MDGWDISQTTRNARAPGGANKPLSGEVCEKNKSLTFWP